MKEMKFWGIEKAKRPVFFCSFGKDSSAVLHGLTPWLSKTMVVFVDCGGMYPDVVGWAKAHEITLPNFQILNAPGDIWDDIKTKGWPMDIEISKLGKFGSILMQEEIASRCKIRQYTECVNERCWVPAMEFTKKYHADLFISGERRQDRPYATDWPLRSNGADMALRPILDWTDEDVWQYIDENDIQLPPTYSGRQKDRMDCALCFGSDYNAERAAYMKKKYPELFRKVFVEEGLAEAVPVIIRNLKKAVNAWEGVERLLEE